MSPKRPTVALTLMLGGSAFSEGGPGPEWLTDCLQSLDVVEADQIVICDTGINDAAKQVIESCTARRKLNTPNLKAVEVYPFTWVDDFSAARNEALRHVTSDYMIWIDGDDVLLGGEHIRPLIEQLDPRPEFLGAWCPYQYSFDDYGNVTTVHTRERIIRMSVGWKWVHRIHEVLTPEEPGVWFDEKNIIWKHLRPFEPQTERNLRLLFMEYAEDPSPRTVQGIANQYFAGGEWEKAADWYERFYMDTRPIVPERWQAMCYASRAYRQVGDYDRALQLAWMAMSLAPHWGDGHLQLAEAYAKLGEWERAIYWGESAKRQKKPPGIVMRNEVEEGAEIGHILHVAYGQVGQWELGLRECNDALAWMPDHEGLLKNQESLEQSLEYETIIRGFIANSNHLTDNQVLSAAKHLNGLSGEPAVRDIVVPALMRRAKIGTQPEVNIFCGETLDEWVPETLHTTGIGGSETAVVEMASRLSQNGWRVWVYNRCGAKEGMHDGVGYIDHRRWRPDMKADTHISWRAPLGAEQKSPARNKWLWMHDLNKGEAITAENTLPFSKVFGVSQFHADYLAQVYPFLNDKLGVLPNGVDLTRFQLEVKRQPWKVIWASSPDRGLLHLLDMWPTVMEREPSAELHIFYGWENIDRLIERGYGDMIPFKNLILARLNQPGVIWRGRVNQTKLAAEFLSSQVWAYPTSFTETFCCGALEAMAADCFIVTSDHGNIPNVVGDTGFLIPGHPGSQSYRQRFLGILLAGLMDVEIKNRFRGLGPERVKSFTWEEAFKVWSKELSQGVPA